MSHAHLTAPQRKVVEFIRLADQATMSFTMGSPEQPVTIPDVQSEIQRMRVELSRQRNIVKGMGKTVRPFKMKVVSVVSNQDGSVTAVLLKDASMQAAAAVLDEAFAGLVGGEKPNV